MANGAHGDLFPVRYYKVDTPVNWVEANEPLQDLEANLLVLDSKLATIMAEGIQTGTGGGGGGGGGGAGASTGPRTIIIDKLTTAGGTDPSAGTLGTNLNTLDFASGVDESHQFEYTVPADYDSGDMEIFVQYAVDGTSGGTVDFDVTEELAAIGGTTSTIGPTTSPLTVSITANEPDELSLWTIADGTFGIGDRFRIEFERQGTTDTNTDTFKLLGFTVVYTGAISTGGAATHIVDLTENTDEPAPAAGTFGTNINTLDHPAGSDAEQKFTATVPQEWDGSSDPILKITYTMSTAVAASVVRVATEVEIANVGTGSIIVQPTQQVDVATPSTTDVARTVSIPFPAGDFTDGSVFAVKVARRNSGVGSNHTGDFRILGYEVIFNTPGTTAGGGGGAGNQAYLTHFSFGNDAPAGAIFAEPGYPDFSTDFEILYTMASTQAAGRVDIAFQGKVPDGFTEIQEITYNLKGSGAGPDYVTKVYEEGSGNTPIYDPTSGTPIAAPGTLGAFSITGGSLTTQPSGDAVFFVVIEAHIDAGETIFVSNPFVTFA
jgi:hypothetical protein